MKMCEDCQIEKELTEFVHSRHTADGLQRRCIDCRKRSRKENHLKNMQNGANLIYVLTNIINQKIYVGQTWSTLEERSGKNGEGYSTCRHLYNAIQKYGFENFHYTILEMCYDQETADLLEDKYMVELGSRDVGVGYNIKEGGRGGKHSEESKEQISQTLKKQFAELSPEERAARATPISTYWLGKERGPHTEEWKQDNSEFMIRRHKENGHPMQGKHHTEEAKELIRQANTGRVDSPETTIKRSLAQMTNPEKQQAIIRAYQEGYTIDQIIEMLETSMGTIYRTLNRHNIPRKDQAKSQGKKASMQ